MTTLVLCAAAAVLAVLLIAPAAYLFGRIHEGARAGGSLDLVDALCAARGNAEISSLRLARIRDIADGDADPAVRLARISLVLAEAHPPHWPATGGRPHRP